MKTSNLLLLGGALLLALSTMASIIVSKGSNAQDAALSGNLTERNYESLPLKHLNLVGPIRLILSAGLPSVTIEADESLQEQLQDQDPDPETLTIEVPIAAQRAGEQVTVRVSTPTLETMSLEGNIRVESSTALPYANNRLDVSGDINLNLAYINASLLELASSGSLQGSLRGVANRFQFEQSGSSSLDAGALAAKVVSVNFSGGSEATVRADSLLSFDGSGGTSLRYYGRPFITVGVSGSGKLESLGM